MSNGSELKSPAAKALRAAGFKPLPRWWVTQEQLDLIEYMIRGNAEQVNAIRTRANATALALILGDKDAQTELAWAQHRQEDG